MSRSLCELDTLMDPMESFVNTLLMLKHSAPSFENKQNHAFSNDKFEIVSPSSHDSESDSFTPNKRPRLDKALSTDSIDSNHSCFTSNATTNTTTNSTTSTKDNTKPTPLAVVSIPLSLTAKEEQAAEEKEAAQEATILMLLSTATNTANTTATTNNSKITARTKENSGTNRGKYRCGRCGQPKTNHVCRVASHFVVQYCATTQTAEPFLYHPPSGSGSLSTNHDSNESSTTKNSGLEWMSAYKTITVRHPSVTPIVHSSPPPSDNNNDNNVNQNDMAMNAQ